MTDSTDADEARPIVAQEPEPSLDVAVQSIEVDVFLLETLLHALR